MPSGDPRAVHVMTVCRLNCRVETNKNGEMVLRVVESFGNCPKYIQGTCVPLNSPVVSATL